MVALFSAGTCSVISLIALHWTDSKKSTLEREILSLSVTGLFMASLTFWTQASFTEVYNVQAFFIALSLYCLQKYALRINRSGLLFASAYFFGIAATLGMYVLILMGIPLIVLLSQKDENLSCLQRFLMYGVCFILGLTLWIYLPVRASLDPPFLYQPIDTIRDFLNYLLRSSYKTSDLAGSLGVLYVLQRFPRLLLDNLGPFGILFLLSAVPPTVKRAKISRLLAGYGIAALLFFLISVLLLPRTLTFVQLIGMDVYYIPFYITLIPFMTIGADFLLKFLRKHFMFLFLMPVVLAIVQHIKSVDISDDTLSDTFKDYLIEWIPRDAVLYPRSDAILHPIFYACIVEQAESDYGLLSGSADSRPYGEIVNDPDQRHLYYEVDQHFISAVDQINRFQLAGPLVTADPDSAAAHNLEAQFAKQFAFQKSDIRALNEQDRFAFGMLWMNRGAFWYNRYKSMQDNHPQRTACYNKTVEAYAQASLLDDFSYLGALSAAMLAQMKLEAGNLDEAERLVQKSIAIHPYTRAAGLAGYRIAIRKRSYRKAQKIIKRLCKTPPYSPSDYFELARLTLYLNDRNQAIRYYHEGIHAGAPPDTALAEKLGIL